MIKKHTIIRVTILSIIVLVFIIFLSIIYTNYIIITPINNIEFKYGVIDGHLSNEYGNVTYSELISTDLDEVTHGDQVIQFIRSIDKESNIFYYDAENKEGRISTQEIVSGLNWMLNNGVNRVNISLSSNYYSEELEQWIIDNARKITIYGSYSNNINSYDYPAMYQQVIGSGYNNGIKYKNIDKKYSSNKIIIWSQDLKKYEGTSFLSPWTMLSSDYND